MTPADEAVRAVRAGDVETLRRLLDAHPELATARLAGPRTLLHVATDWPGGLPNVAQMIDVLVAAGADVDARFESAAHEETPLHWAASADDVEALDALLDAGADIEADGAIIGGGTALADATAFGQWRAAWRLIERGAEANLWEAAALGLLDRVHEQLAADPPTDDITAAFWGACHGGQLPTARVLLDAGADPTWLGWDELTPLQAARRAGADDVVRWLEALPRR